MQPVQPEPRKSFFDLSLAAIAAADLFVAQINYSTHRVSQGHGSLRNNLVSPFTHLSVTLLYTIMKYQYLTRQNHEHTP